MNQIWLQVFAVMIGGSALKYVFSNQLMWVGIDLAVLGICYALLKRHPYIDLKKSMSYLGALTTISVLVDLGVVGGEVGNIAVLALLAYMIFGGGLGGGRRRR
ncbi:hypothetical protein [Dendrosporobacter sp. 1207_IL3150]|uniref:hypothetical protein n=1 Tax=Dendrosporobacter sp. 1207_IL3150 TaxID=3084054 RepID=UPI002FDB1138